MNNWSEIIVNNYQRFIRFGVLIFSILIIALIMPQSSFNYNFEEGKLWQSEDLLAPFSFPVLKTDSRYNADVNQVTEEFVPYYNKLNVEYEKISKFRASLDLKFSTQPDSTFTIAKEVYYKTGEELLGSIYQKGIIHLPEKHKDKQVIYLNDDAGTSLKELNSFYNNVTALSFLKERLALVDDLDPNKLLVELRQSIVPNIVEDIAYNEKLLSTSLENISKYEQAIQKGQNIIDNGDIVTPEIYQQLISLQEEYKTRSNESEYWSLRLLGYVIISGLCFVVLFFFLRFYEPLIYSSIRKYTFMFLLVVFFLILTRLLVSGNFEPVSYYLIPFCVLPILLRSFFQVGVFSYVYLITLVLSYFILPVGYDYLVLHLVVGYIAFESSSRTYYWSQFFSVIGIVLLAYCVGYTGLELIRNNSISGIDFSVYPYLLGNALLTILSYPLIPLFEKFFGFLSKITLVELSDLNKPLLRELQSKAPGTMHHSLEVANLAENAAREIKADYLLVKVGALYHDVGKMNKPIFFIENQENIMNPHDDLEPEESAKIIVDHIIEGIEIAKSYNLPNILIDFIRTHHGETRVEYFYRKYCEKMEDDHADEDGFVYPGPLPYSKETALLMLADSVEAATKSLKNPTGVAIDEFIDNIINYKINANQLVNSNLSFKDVQLIRKSFKRSLRSKYHIRIEYPKTKEKINMS